MPSRKAATPEEQCLAFTKDHRRCRLQRDEGSKTCPYHTQYFSTWLETHPGFQRSSSSRRLIEEYEFTISNRNIEIPELYIEAIDINYSEYYAYLIDQTGYSAAINTRCLKYCVSSLAWPMIIAENLTTTKQMFNSLAPLFTDVESTMVCFTRLWKEIVETFRFYEKEESAYMKRFRQVFYSPIWRPIMFNRDLWYTIQTIWEANQAREVNMMGRMNPHLRFKEEWSRERFQDMLYEVMSYHQKRVKDRIQPFKEELIAAAWHPRRVEKWLEMGGFELLDSL